MKYIEGTIVQHRDYYRYIKTPKGLMPESRWVAQEKILHRDLFKNERVFHRDCQDRADNSVENLVVIKFRTNPLRPLPSSRIIYVPKMGLREVAA